MQLMPPRRSDDGPVTRRNSARGHHHARASPSGTLLRSPDTPTVANNRLYRAPQASVRSGSHKNNTKFGNSAGAGGDRVTDTLFGKNQPSHGHSHNHGLDDSTSRKTHGISNNNSNNNNNNSSTQAPVSASGTRRRRRGQQQRPFLMEKQISDNSLGISNLTPKEHRKESMTAHAYASSRLSPHISMPSAPPLWTDVVADDPIPRLSPPPIHSNHRRKDLSSLSPYKPSSKRHLLVKRAHHGSLPAGTNHTDTHHSHSNHHNHDHSDHPLLDEDSFGSPSTHHNSSHDGPLQPSHLSLNSNHNSHRTFRRSKQKQRWCLQNAVRNSCWYAASAATAAQHGNHKNKRATKMTWRLFYTAFKVLVIAASAGFVYDSHHRVHTHKMQMEEYDHERREILEQMMWIDKAAKKVHKKYAASSTDPVTSSSNTATESASATTSALSSLPQDLVGKITTQEQQTQLRSLQTSLNQLKVHIQLNARDLLAEKFGDRPAQVSLQIRRPTTTTGGESSVSSATSANHEAIDNQHLVVALSDDTPHATATFVQQIDKHYWDDLEFETVTDTGSVSSDSIQAIQILSKTRNNASPVLEFVEASRGCHQVGSVALRQVPDGPFHHVLVLRIYVTEQDQHSHHNDDGQEVCIGKVLHGLDQVLLPELLHEKQQEQEQEKQEQQEEASEQLLEQQQEQMLREQARGQEQEQLLVPELEEYHGGPPEEEIPLGLRQQDESPQVIDTSNPRGGMGEGNKDTNNDEDKSNTRLRGSLGMLRMASKPGASAEGTAERND